MGLVLNLGRECYFGSHNCVFVKLFLFLCCCEVKLFALMCPAVFIKPDQPTDAERTENIQAGCSGRRQLHMLFEILVKSKQVS